MAICFMFIHLMPLSLLFVLVTTPAVMAFVTGPQTSKIKRPISLRLSTNHQQHPDQQEEKQQSSATSSSSSASSSPWFIAGPPEETKPNYQDIHGPLGKDLDTIFLKLFRSKMAEKMGIDSSLPKDDYNGIMELAAAMNARYSDRTKVQETAQEVLRALFPSWLPGQYAILFSKPFPEFSARMNAWATKYAGTWLMGECDITNVELSDGTIKENQGLLVKRCRFLQESKCASVCVNSCKIPTQNFFIQDMGLPLTMTPNYETFECQFEFGKLPTKQTELEAKATPCLQACPSAGSLRTWHNDKTSTTTGNDNINNNNNNNNKQRETVDSNDNTSNNNSGSTCRLMK